MVYKTIPRFKIIENKNPVKLTDELNGVLEVIAEHDSINVTTGFDASIGHYAHIRWSEEKVIPESIADEFKLEGIQYCCGECPFFILQQDRRIKHSVCNKGRRTTYDTPACDCLYEMIRKGEIEID